MGDSHTYIDVVIEGEDRTIDLARTPTLSIGRHPLMELPDDVADLFTVHVVELNRYEEAEEVRALNLDELPRLVEAFPHGP